MCLCEVGSLILTRPHGTHPSNMRVWLRKNNQKDTHITYYLNSFHLKTWNTLANSGPLTLGSHHFHVVNLNYSEHVFDQSAMASQVSVMLCHQVIFGTCERRSHYMFRFLVMGSKLPAHSQKLGSTFTLFVSHKVTYGFALAAIKFSRYSNTEEML